MSSAFQKVSCFVEPFEERVDILFRELELAVKWQRPSILFAIYSSEYLHADAVSALENKLAALGQEVFHYQVKNEANSDITIRLAKTADLEQMIVFVDGLRWGGGQDGSQAFTALNLHREYFVDHRVRIIFWLTESEAVALANYAPDYWAFRHRVVEFVDSQKPKQGLQSAPESPWEGTGEYTDTLDDIDAQIALRESLLTDLPEGNESTATHAHLDLRLGILHWRKGDYEKAFAFLQKALETSEKLKDTWFEAECYNAVALVQTGRGKIDEAIEAYKQAIRLAPDQIFPWNNLGSLYSQLDRGEEALEAFRKAIEHNPTDAVSWNGLGNVYFKLGLMNNALATYKKAIEISPGFVYPWNGLGNVFASTGRIEEAITAYQNAVSLNGRLSSAWLNLGNIFTQQRHYGEALQAYQKTVEIDPKNFWVWNEIGNLYFKTSAYEDAAAAYSKAVELAPASAWLYNNLALTCSLRGQYAEAIRLYRNGVDLLKKVEQKAILLGRIGDACRRMNDAKNAAVAYQRAVDFGADPAWFGRDLDVAPHSLTPAGWTPAYPGGDLPQPLEQSWKFVTLPPLHEAPETTAESPADLPDAVSAKAPEQVLVAEVASAASGSDPPVESAGNIAIALGQPADEAAMETVQPGTEEGSNPVKGQEVPGTLDATASGSGSGSAAEPVSAGIKILAESEPQDACGWNEQGNAHFKTGHYEEAVLAYIKAIELSAGFSWPYINNLALVYHHRNQHKGEETDLQPVELAEARPSVEAAPAGGVSPFVVEDQPLSGAEGVESPAVETSASSPLAVLPSGEQDGDMSKREATSWDYHPPAASINLIEEAIQEDTRPRPRGGEHKGLRITEQKAVSSPEKERLLEAARNASQNGAGEGKSELIPANAEEWNELGNVYLQNGAHDQAVSAFTSAIALDPQNGCSYGNLALAYCFKRRFTEAIPLYRKSIELLKDSREKAVAWNRLGDAYRRLNEHRNAKKAYQQAVELDSEASSLKTRARFVLLGNSRS